MFLKCTFPCVGFYNPHLRLAVVLSWTAPKLSHPLAFPRRVLVKPSHRRGPIRAPPPSTETVLIVTTSSLSLSLLQYAGRHSP